MHRKAALVELFLLMNANPFSPSSVTGTAFQHAERLPPLSKERERIFQLLGIEPKRIQPDESVAFIKAVEEENIALVRKMLTEGFPYSDSSCYSTRFTLLHHAVITGCFEIVVELVRRGAMIQDQTMVEWLQNEAAAAKQARLPSRLDPVRKLFELEKERQLSIFKAFCEAPGNSPEEKLESCRSDIVFQNQFFERNLQRLRADAKVFSDTTDIPFFKGKVPEHVSKNANPLCLLM